MGDINDDKSFIEFVTGQTVATKHLAGKHDQDSHGLHGKGEPTPAQLSARIRAAAGRERKRQAAAAAAGQPGAGPAKFVDRFGKSEAPDIHDASAADLANEADYYVWHNFAYHATELKHKVATNLSRGANIDYAEASDSVHSWAISSNDSNINSLNMQRIAGEVFGANFTEWQKKNYNGMLALNKHDYGGPNTILSDDETKTFLKTMYRQTQTELKTNGIKEVVVYRGFSFEGDVGEAANWQIGDKVKIGMNAMSSWSSDKQTALNFGYGNHVIFEMKVPASRVMATPHTGFGCYAEHEFVLLGDPDGDMATIVSGRIKL